MQLSEEMRSVALKVLQLFILGPLAALTGLFALIMLCVGELMLALKLAVAGFVPVFLLCRTLPSQLRRVSGTVSKQERATLERIKYALGVQSPGVSFSFRVEKQSVHASYLPGGGGQAASLEIVAPTASGASFRIYHEGGHERALKKLGLLQEVQTGDDLFDRRWYIETDRPGGTEKLLNNPAARDAVSKVMLNRFDEIAVSGGKLRARAFGAIHEKGLHAVHLRRAAQELVLLAATLSSTDGGQGFVERIDNLCRTFVVAVSAVAVSMLGVSIYDSALLHWQALDGARVILRGILFGLPLIAAYIYAVIIVVRSRARAIGKLIFAAMFSVPGLIYLSAGIFLQLNGRWDSSEEVLHQAAVQDVDRRGGSIHVKSWRKPGRAEELVVPEETAEALEPESLVAISVKRGYFGMPWVSDIEHMSWEARH